MMERRSTKNGLVRNSAKFEYWVQKDSFSGAGLSREKSTSGEISGTDGKIVKTRRVFHFLDKPCFLSNPLRVLAELSRGTR